MRVDSKRVNAGNGSGKPGRAWETGWRPDLVAVCVLALLTVIFFRRFVFSDLMLFGTDTVPTGYMARKVYAEFLTGHGVIPLWNPYILGGLPFIDALHGDALYPASLMNLFLSVHRFIGIKLVVHVFVAGLCMYAFLRVRGLRHMASLVGGVGYAFAPYLVSLIYAGHDGKLYVTALLPLAFTCLARGLGTLKAFYFVMLGGVVGLILLTSHVQMAAYALWGLGLYLIIHLIGVWRRDRSFRAWGRPILLFAAGVFIGFALGLVQFLPAYLYTSAFSPRAGGVSYEYATSWSLHPEEIVSLVIPQFVHYLDAYWGRNPFKLNCEAPGILLLLLGSVALCLRWGRRAAAVFLVSVVLFFLSMASTGAVRMVFTLLAVGGFVYSIARARDLAFYLLVSVFALFYAVGAHTPLYRVFFEVIPGVKFFRAPSTIMMLFLFATAALAGFGADRIQSAGRSPEGQRILRFLVWGVGAGVVLLAVLAVGREVLVNAWEWGVFPEMGGRRGILEANYPAFLKGVGIALLLAAGAALCVWLVSTKKVRPAWVVGGLGILTIASVWPVDGDFVQTLRVEEFVVRDPITHRMTEDPDLFRVLPVTGNRAYDRNYLPIFGLQTVNGFHDNRLRIFDEFTADGRLLNGRVLDLYNTKYVVTTRPVAGETFELLEDLGGKRLYLNRMVLPRAFLAFNFEVIPDGARALERLMDPDFDYRSILILEEAPPGLRPDGSRLPIPAEVLAYGANEIRIRTRGETPGLLFIGDNYFPYWRARVDGAPARILRCDYAFRAVPVPGGTHEVVLTYRSNPLLAGAGVSGAAGVLVLGWLVVHLVRRASRRPRDNA